MSFSVVVENAVGTYVLGRGTACFGARSHVFFDWNLARGPIARTIFSILAPGGMIGIKRLIEINEAMQASVHFSPADG